MAQAPGPTADSCPIHQALVVCLFEAYPVCSYLVRHKSNVVAPSFTPFPFETYPVCSYLVQHKSNVVALQCACCLCMSLPCRVGQPRYHHLGGEAGWLLQGQAREGMAAGAELGPLIRSVNLHDLKPVCSLCISHELAILFTQFAWRQAGIRVTQWFKREYV